MLLVSEIFDEVKRVMRECDDAAVFNRISDATEILCNKLDIDPLIGWVDIVTTSSRWITLPREIDSVLAINISGRPTFPRNRWAEFHLNGFGSEDTSRLQEFWDDKGSYAIFTDPTSPVRFTASSSNNTDDSFNELWVFGYDQNDKWVTSIVGGNPVDGYKVAISDTQQAPSGSEPLFSRVTGVRKSQTLGQISLWGTTAANVTSLYGEYAPKDTVPSFRRILLSKEAEWVRVMYRKRVFRVGTLDDMVPLNSRYALMLMVKALQKYDDDKLEEGTTYEEKAVQFMLERQRASNPPGGPSFQVSNATRLIGSLNRMD